MAGGAALAAPAVFASSAPPRAALVLPFSGADAGVGRAIARGFRMALMKASSPMETVMLDSAQGRAVTVMAARRLVETGRANFLVGSLLDGETEDLVGLSRAMEIPLIIPDTGTLHILHACVSPMAFRTSFTNEQAGSAVGEAAFRAGHRRAAVFVRERRAGEWETVSAFKTAFTASGGEILGNTVLPFTEKKFGPSIKQAAEREADMLFTGLSRGGAAGFLFELERSGLKGRFQTWGTLLTEGVLHVVGEAADGIRTVLHWADGLDPEWTKEFQKPGSTPHVMHGVHGYDAAMLLLHGLRAVGGDASASKDMADAMASAVLDSPRGRLAFSRAHNPIQDFHLRQVRSGANVVLETTHPRLAPLTERCKD